MQLEWWSYDPRFNFFSSDSYAGRHAGSIFNVMVEMKLKHALTISESEWNCTTEQNIDKRTILTIRNENGHSQSEDYDEHGDADKPILGDRLSHVHTM